MLTTPFQDGINALCWPPHTLEGFGEVATASKAAVGITNLDEVALRRRSSQPCWEAGSGGDAG